MFRKIEDFITAWPVEAGFTSKVFEAIPDKYADQAIADGHRTLKRLAWHLVETVIGMPKHFGILVDGHEMVTNDAICAPPATMAEVKIAYEKASKSFTEGLKSWTDDTLLQEDEMYGEKYTRSHSLTIIMCHQIHHRGEMFVLMRQAGLIPPDIYGPTKEGWATYGMEPPKV
ncbi:MAG: DinB family protein [Holophagaceae bacterium]|nr:DinB family protein [Holophagaceae bacterium]